MTVAELIEKLREFPPNLVVSVDGYEDGVTDGIAIAVKKVRLNANSEWWSGEHDDNPREEANGERLVLGR